MRDPDNFKDQVAILIDNHDGMTLILEHYGVSSDTAAKSMVEEFLNGIHRNRELVEKLKGLGAYYEDN